MSDSIFPTVHSAVVLVVVMAAVSAAAPVAQPASFTEEWASPSSSWFGLNAPSPGKAQSGQAGTGSGDGKVLRLEVPAGAKPGPAGGPQAETGEKFLYGEFSARLRTTDCTGQPDAGVVTGLFTYFNDGSDGNGDGIADNSEIDFEWLCAEPQTIFLTLWTDYSEAKHKRVGRQIDLAAGKVKYTSWFEAFGPGTPLSGDEDIPIQVSTLQGYNSAARFHEYGFSWSSEKVTWWIVHPETGARLVLWDYRGPKARIPMRPGYFMINAWHSDSWPADSRPNSVLPPNAPVQALVDWARFAPPGATGLPRVYSEAGNRTSRMAGYPALPFSRTWGGRNLQGRVHPGAPAEPIRH